MTKENKIILALQIIATILVAIFIIQQPWKMDFNNPKTGEYVGLLGSILYFGLVLLIFGMIWGAGLFIFIVERLLVF